MKRALILLTLVSFTALSSALGKGAEYLVKDEYISGGQIAQAFNLRAADGSVLEFFTGLVKDDSVLQYLPPENGADYSKCSDSDINSYLAMTDIFIRLMNASIDGGPAVLTPAEATLISRTPRCGRQKEIMLSIATVLKPGPSKSSQQLDKLSVIKSDRGSFVELKTCGGGSALFLVSGGLPKKVKSLSDLTGLVVNAASSGQNLGLKVALGGFHDGDTPSDTGRTEACTITREVRICEKGQCHTRTITETGVRYIRTRTTFDTTSYSLTLTDAQNRVVYRGELMDGEFDSDEIYSGPCMRH